MSVAFRRDSDEEHKEPRFELPLPPGPNLVTERGLAQIQARVRELEAKIALEEVSGNASEDKGDAPDEAKRELRYYRTREATAQIGPPPAGDQVAFGTRVRFKLSGSERTIFIVGDDEADPALFYVSFAAPLVKAMLGAIPGDLLPFAGKEDAIEIVEIDPIS